jgi:hypothetical protein
MSEHDEQVWTTRDQVKRGLLELVVVGILGGLVAYEVAADIPGAVRAGLAMGLIAFGARVGLEGMVFQDPGAWVKRWHDRDE